MKKSTDYRVKFLAMMVVMAFSWITIGSLVMFHQEHVLKKHVDLQTYLFVAPKNKDKSGHLKQCPQVQKNNSAIDSAPLADRVQGSLQGWGAMTRQHLTACIPIPEAFPPGSHALRAPPAC